MVKDKYITEDELAESQLTGLNPRALKRIRAGGSDIATIKVMRICILSMALKGISTATIARVLKRRQPAIQYHLRCLEDEGHIKRESPNSHWKTDEL